MHQSAASTLNTRPIFQVELRNAEPTSSGPRKRFVIGRVASREGFPSRVPARLKTHSRLWDVQTGGGSEKDVCWND